MYICIHTYIHTYISIYLYIYILNKYTYIINKYTYIINKYTYTYILIYIYIRPAAREPGRVRRGEVRRAPLSL